MHRFGRPAQQKDRWGGGFVLATILALLAAWIAGDYIGKLVNGKNTASTGNNTGNPKAGMTATAEPGDFQLRFVKVGVFRSKANINNVVRDMEKAGLTPVVGATPANNMTPVYVGPFMDNDLAETAKAKVQALKKDYETATVMAKSVKYNPEAVPAATAGGQKSDLRKGMDLLNTYLQEVALWMEDPANTDTAALAEYGKDLKDVAGVLSDSKDATAKKITDMASTASANAAAIEALAGTSAADPEYQAAMAQYMTLLDQYIAFQAGK